MKIRSPILWILLPYIVFIIIFENDLFGETTIVMIYVLYVIIHNTITMIYLVKKINYCFIQILIQILCIVNLCNFYENDNNNNTYKLPDREVILKIKISNSQNTVKYYDTYYKICHGIILEAPIETKKLVGEKITCLIKNYIDINTYNKILLIKGIISKNKKFGSRNFTLNRCDIIKEDAQDLKSKSFSSLLRDRIKNSLGIKNSASVELSGFLNAIFLGDKSMLTNNQIDLFKRNGTLHLFAVSGLHIGFLYLILKFSITFFIRKRFIIELIIVYILLIYLEIVEYPPSAVRACTMVFIWQLSSVLFKRKNSYSSLMWSCFIMLIINPSYITSIGFQLSYSVVLTIIVSHYHLQDNDSLGKFWIYSYIKTSILISYSAFCGSLILVYDNFDIIVPISIIINIVAIPIAFLFVAITIIMLVIQNLLEVRYFMSLFLVVYEFLTTFLSFVSFENISYLRVKEKSDMNDMIHFFYPILFICYFHIFKNTIVKIVGHLLIPFFLIILFSSLFIQGI